jgi:hypothetical protein
MYVCSELIGTLTSFVLSFWHCSHSNDFFIVGCHFLGRELMPGLGFGRMRSVFRGDRYECCSKGFIGEVAVIRAS